MRSQFAIVCLALLLVFEAEAQYNIPSAREYACRWCYFENEEYDLCHANTCLHFVSQVLQHGCMGICDGYFCDEFTDPASTAPHSTCEGGSRCLRCDPNYMHDGKPFTMTNNSGGGIPFFQESQYWNIQGPFSPAEFRTSPSFQGPTHRPQHGDVVLYRYAPGHCEGHAMWIAENEHTPPQYWLQALYAANNNPACPPWNGQGVCYNPGYYHWLRDHIDWLVNVHPDAEVYIAWPTGAPGRRPQANPNPPQGRWQSEDNPHVVTENIVVQTGTQLSMEPGVEVVFGESGRITVEPGAVLRLDGTPSMPITLQSSDANASWGGVVIESNESFGHLFNVVIRDATVGLFINEGSSTIQNVTIENCDIGVAALGSDVTFDNCDFSHNDRCGAYAISSNVSFNNCEFNSNGKGGLRIWRALRCRLSNCVVNSNGASWDPSIEAHWSGVQILQGDLVLDCNSIEENYGSGLSLFSITYADLGENAGRNVIQNNMQILGPAYSLDDGQILLAGGTPGLECGLNTIRDAMNTNTLIRSWYGQIPADGWDVSNNYWGTTNIGSIALRLANNPSFEPVLDRSWECQEVNLPPCDEDPDELHFREAWALERQAQYSQALSTYESYLDLYPNGKHKDVVVDRILFCKDAVGYSWPDIRAYFLALAADSSKDSTVVALCKSNAAWCLTEMGDFEGAYFELDSLLDHASTEYLQLTMQLKLLLLELEQDEFGLSYTQGKKRSISRLDSDQNRMMNKLMRIDSRLDSLLQVSQDARKRPSGTQNSIPFDFELYSNYPNPFNSETRIRFSLAMSGQTTVKVYDVTGRLVSTLLDDVLDAGHHQVAFSGENISSGVYFYQLRAGANYQTRKMVLIK